MKTPGKKAFRVAVTGHRNLRDEETRIFVPREVRRLLERFKREQANLEALSALAEGADTIFARTALDLGIPLVAVIPFARYEEDFSASALETFRELLGRASRVIRLRHRQRSNEAYLAAGKWLVDHADALLAVWDGRPAAGKGGTGDVVEYALAHGLPVVHIDIREQKVKEIGHE